MPQKSEILPLVLVLPLRGGIIGGGLNRELMAILRDLEQDGISSATYAQVANQRMVRTVAINGLTPEADNYPYFWVLYYAHQEPPSPQVKAFLGYVLSSQGQTDIASAG